jgi:hypothetical protein
MPPFYIFNALILIQSSPSVKPSSHASFLLFVHPGQFLKPLPSSGLSATGERPWGPTRQRRAGKAGTDRDPKGVREFRKGLPARAALVGQGRRLGAAKARASQRQSERGYAAKGLTGASSSARSAAVTVLADLQFPPPQCSNHGSGGANQGLLTGPG